MSSVSFAQDGGGLNASVTLSQGLTYSDVDGTQGRTNLGFNINSTTRTQSFAFAARSGLQQDFESGLSANLINPSASLSYGIQNRPTAFSADMSYSQADADDFVTDPDGAPGVLVLDEGTREDTSANLGWEFGREARFGGSINLGYSETTYSDTSSLDLIDRQTGSTGINLRFELDPRITATLGYSFSDTDRAIGRDVQNERLSSGVQLAVTPSLSANVSLGVTRVTEIDGGVETVTDGLSYNIALNQDRTLGNFQFSFGSALSETGRRTTANVGGTFDTQRGAFSANAGLSQGADDRIRPVFGLTYDETLARGSYSVSVNQAFEASDDGDETLNSRLRLSWNQNLTRTSRMSTDLTYQVTDVLGMDDDTSRLQLGVSYSRDLTQDWALTTRYTHSFVNEDNDDNSSENKIFLGLETSFGWRP